jgi:hypothetical protein
MTHSEDNKSMLNQGVFIFVYLAVLTGLEFFLAIKLQIAVPLLIVVALVKAVLVVYYYMHIYKLNAEQEEGDHDSYEYKSGTNRIGLWLFLVSDSFVFAGLMMMRINLLGLTRPNLNQLLGLAVTAVLLIIVLYEPGETLMKNGDRKGFLNNILITFLMGLGFLIEWSLWSGDLPVMKICTFVRCSRCGFLYDDWYARLPRSHRFDLSSHCLDQRQARIV